VYNRLRFPTVNETGNRKKIYNKMKNGTNLQSASVIEKLELNCWLHYDKCGKLNINRVLAGLILVQKVKAYITKGTDKLICNYAKTIDFHSLTCLTTVFFCFFLTKIIPSSNK
jgi:hypothetical protein